MKIHFNPKEFSSKFKLAASVAAARDIKPILQNVKIKADKKFGAILQATDTELGIRIRVDCDVTTNGEAILPTKRLTQILDLTGEEQLTIESIENDEKSEYVLNAQLPDDDEYEDDDEYNEDDDDDDDDDDDEPVRRRTSAMVPRGKPQRTIIKGEN